MNFLSTVGTENTYRMGNDYRLLSFSPGYLLGIR